MRKGKKHSARAPHSLGALSNSRRCSSGCSAIARGLGCRDLEGIGWATWRRSRTFTHGYGSKPCANGVPPLYSHGFPYNCWVVIPINLMGKLLTHSPSCSLQEGLASENPSQYFDDITSFNFMLPCEDTVLQDTTVMKRYVAFTGGQ